VGQGFANGRSDQWVAFDVDGVGRRGSGVDGPALATFDDLMVLDAPEYPIGDPKPDLMNAAHTPDDGMADEEEEELGRGLHAKLLFMRSGQKRRLWLGSANATIRCQSALNSFQVTAPKSFHFFRRTSAAFSVA
jgi:hypothetical protein